MNPSRGAETSSIDGGVEPGVRIDPSIHEGVGRRSGGRAARRGRIGNGVALLGAAMFLAGWLIPHSSSVTRPVLTILATTAESDAAAQLPAGVALSDASVLASAQAAGAADPELLAGEGGRRLLRGLIPGCGSDAGCVETAGEKLRADVMARMVANGETATVALEAQLGALDAWDGEGGEAAGPLTGIDPAAFRSLAVSGGIPAVGPDWTSSFRYLREYQAQRSSSSYRVAVQNQLDALAEPAAVADSAFGQVDVGSDRVRKGNVFPIALSFAGLILALGALAVGGPRRTDRPRLMRRGVVALVSRVLLVAVAVAVALTALDALALRDGARDASRDLQRTLDALSARDFDAASQELTRLRAFTRSARSHTNRPWQVVGDVLPGARSERLNLRDMIATMDRNLSVGERFVATMDELAQPGIGYVARLTELSAAIDEASRLETIDDPIGLTASAESVRLRHDDTVNRLVATARRNGPLVQLLRDAATDGRRYLVVVGSTSEQRTAMGGFFMIGVAHLDDSGPVVDGLRSIGSTELSDVMVPFVDPTVAPAVDDQLDALLGGFAVGSDWTTLSLSPQFPSIAPVAREMWKAVGGEPVDGVLYLDPVLLRQLLGLVGPVQLGDTAIDVDNVVYYLDDYQYRGELGTQSARIERQDVLREMVEGVLAALRADEPDAEWLSALRYMASTRHLMMWSPDTDIAAASTALGGRLGADSLGANVVSINGKYDPYLDVVTTADVECSSGVPVVHLKLSATYRDTPEPHGYLSGSLWFAEQPDRVAGLVNLVLPAAATLDLAGAGPAAIVGRDGAVFRYSSWIDIERGRTADVEVTFGIPEGSELAIVPSGGAYPRNWVIAGGQPVDTSIALGTTLQAACGG